MMMVMMTMTTAMMVRMITGTSAAAVPALLSYTCMRTKEKCIIAACMCGSGSMLC